jgi:hypothetical protein
VRKTSKDLVIAGSVALRGIIVQFWRPRDAEMTKPIARDPMYRRRRFDAEIIELCVRWYISRKAVFGPSPTVRL